MTIKKRGLGRGLEALLVDVSTKEEKHQQQTQPIDNYKKSNHLTHDDMNSEGLEEFTNAKTRADTIEQVVERKTVENNYEIVAGENRWSVAGSAGLQEIPVIIEEMYDREAIAAALIETIKKENLNLLQEANNLKKLIDEFEAMVRHL